MDSPLSTRCAILQTLRVQRRGYAAEIIAHVHATTEERISLREGTVYPLLRQLEREGLIEAAPADAAPQRTSPIGRPGRAYVLTALGRQEATSEAAVLLALLGHPAPTLAESQE